MTVLDFNLKEMGMKVHYLSYTHPNLELRPISQSNIGAIGKGKWCVVCRVESTANNGGYIDTNSEVGKRLAAARKVKADLMVFVFEDEKYAHKYYCQEFSEEKAPYTILIDNKGELICENT